jgi:Dolichyl-phosphate-mannose-protein mannosyltransferase
METEGGNREPGAKSSTWENPRRILFYLAVVAAFGYGALLIQNLGFGVGGSDSSGYANAARLMLSSRAVAPIDALDLLGLPDRFGPQFTPLAFVPGPRPRTMAPFYPPGFPMHIALASLVAGWDAGPFVVSPIAAIFCLLLTYALARELGLSRLFSLAGAAILGGCGVYLFQAVQAMSDVVATCWSVAAVLFALRARRRRSWALAAGAAFGIAVLVRPTDLLLALPLAFALPWNLASLGRFLAGGVPFGAFLLAWNRAAYGSALATGYSGLGGEFALAHFWPRFQHYGKWVIAQLSPLIPLGWLASVGDRKIPWRERIMLVVWFAAYFLFYCGWGPYDAWWYTRFLLPAIPALIVGFLLVARDLIHRLPEREAGGPRRHLRAATVLVLLLVIAGAEWRIARRFRPLKTGRSQAVFREACRWLAEKGGERSAGKALVVSMEFSGAVRFYTDFPPLRWDVVNPEDFQVIQARAAERGYRIFGVVFPKELAPARAHVPGNWTLVQTFGGATIWRLD